MLWFTTCLNTRSLTRCSDGIFDAMINQSTYLPTLQQDPELHTPHTYRPRPAYLYKLNSRSLVLL